MKNSLMAAENLFIKLINYFSPKKKKHFLQFSIHALCLLVSLLWLSTP